VIARIFGCAVDARAAARASDPVERAYAARWIAANWLAVRRLVVAVDGALPGGVRTLALTVASATGVLAALAVVPALVDVAALPLAWRLSLRVLGVPVLDRSPDIALAAGATIISSLATAAATIHVEAARAGFRVRLR
jgi:hypothetical protein